MDLFTSGLGVFQTLLEKIPERDLPAHRARLLGRWMRHRDAWLQRARDDEADAAEDADEAEALEDTAARTDRPGRKRRLLRRARRLRRDAAEALIEAADAHAEAATWQAQIDALEAASTSSGTGTTS